MKSLTFRPDPAADAAAAARPPVWRTRLLALAAAAVLVALGAAFAMLVSAPKRTLDALVIVTLPSGAEVVFDGAALGPSPVTLEGVRVGRHVVRAEKAGFVGAEVEVDLEADADAPLELRLKPIAPPGSVARTPAEQISEFTSLAEDAFARDELVLPADRSALYYADAILSLDARSEYALGMRERIRERLLAGAKAAAARKDFVRAKEAYEQLLRTFPADAAGRAGLAAVGDQLRRESSRAQEFVAAGRRALDEGRLVEPDGRSAYAYAARALAADADNPQARALRRRVRDAALEEAGRLIGAGRIDAAVSLLRRLAALYPDDRPVRARLDALLGGDALGAYRRRREAGLAAFEAGDYRQAADQLRAAARLGALDARAYEALGLALVRLGDAEAARLALERAAVQEEGRARALVALGALAERRGDARAAARYYRRAAAAGGDGEHDAARLEAMAEALERRGQAVRKP